MKEKLKPILKRLGIYMVTIGAIRLTVAAAGLIAEKRGLKKGTDTFQHMSLHII